MYYSESVKRAACICFEAHREDKDKGGYPYVFHPFYLAVQMDEEDAVCTALLHDVAEDHGERYSFERLSEEGFPEAVIEALRLLTHEKDVPYMDYIKQIAENPLARQVKLADLRHNLDSRRVDGKKTEKYDLYQEAVQYLETYLEEN